jgi:hypothetical protein
MHMHKCVPLVSEQLIAVCSYSAFRSLSVIGRCSAIDYTLAQRIWTYQKDKGQNKNSRKWPRPFLLNFSILKAIPVTGRGGS